MTSPEPHPLPSPRAAILVFVGVLLSNFAMGLLLSRSGLDENWILVATPLVVLFWTFLAVRHFRLDFREALFLRLPSLADLLMALPLAISFVILSDQLSNLTESLIPPEIQAQMLEMIRVVGPADWVLKIATIGLGAAVSEELLLRGFILNVFRRGMSRSAAILFTALLFTALHVLPLPSIAAAGVVLGFTALATRSIAVPILIHLVNNLYVLALVNLAHLDTLGDPVWIPPEILLPAAAIFVLTAAYYGRHFSTDPESGHAAVPPPSGPSAAGGESGVRGAGNGSERERERESENLHVELSPRGPGRRGPSLSHELSSIPPRRRRLGWLVVLLAVLVGTSVLFGLFVYTVYLVRPQTIHVAVIEAMSQDAKERLAPEARGREAELAGSFQALAAVSDAGGLDESQLWEVVRVYVETITDGRIDANEIDQLLAVIRRATAGATSPRRL